MVNIHGFLPALKDNPIHYSAFTAIIVYLELSVSALIFRPSVLTENIKVIKRDLGKAKKGMGRHKEIASRSADLLIS